MSFTGYIRHQAKHRLLLCAAALLLAGCGAAETAPTGAGATTAATSAPAAATSAPAAGTPIAPGKPTGKLSQVLALLADPTVSTQSAEAQASAVGLPASGPGSLMRSDAGEVLVVIRMSDVADSSVAAVEQAGARVVNTATDLAIITAYIRPDQLSDLEAVPAVQNVREELSP